MFQKASHTGSLKAMIVWKELILFQHYFSYIKVAVHLSMLSWSFVHQLLCTVFFMPLAAFLHNIIHVMVGDERGKKSVATMIVIPPLFSSTE